MRKDFGRQVLPDLPVHPDRRALVLEHCGGRRVLHVGCSDAPYTADRLASGELLHARIQAIASDLWGVDRDAESLDLLRDAGYEQLVEADICERGSLDPLGREPFDIIVATEVIEHLVCPGAALDNLVSLMEPGKTRLLVTVPNAYRIDTLLGFLRGVEFVHPDHNAWYSWYTAVMLVTKAGLSVIESGFYSHHRPGLLPSSLIDAVLGVRSMARNVLHSSLGRVGDAEDPPSIGSAGNGAPRFERGARRVVSASGEDERPQGWLKRLRGYVVGLPPRVAVTLLARRPALWADGIYLLAGLPSSREAGE